MDDEELEAIRKRKLQEIRMQREQQVAMEEERHAVDEQRQAIIRQILTPEARERLGRVRIARPEMVRSIEDQLILLAQSGRLGKVINDEELQALLMKIMPEKREIKITRK